MKDFKNTLIAMVKGAGQDLIDRAEELVGDDELMTGFDIHINFGMYGGLFEEGPTIEVSKNYLAKKSFDVFVASFEKEKENA